MVHVYIIFSVHVEAGPFWSIWMKLGLLEWITRMECPGWNLVLMICMNSRSHDDRYQSMHMRIYRNAVYMVLFAVPRVLFQSTSFFSKLRHVCKLCLFSFCYTAVFVYPHTTQHGAKGEDDWKIFSHISGFPLWTIPFDSDKSQGINLFTWEVLNLNIS